VELPPGFKILKNEFRIFAVPGNCNESVAKSCLCIKMGHVGQRRSADCVLATIRTAAGADSASSVISAAKCSAHCMVKRNGWQQICS
jgi:hypothetical protein